MTYASSFGSRLGNNPNNSVTVGASGTNYPISSTAAAGGAAKQWNQAMSDLNGSNGGNLYLLGGPGKTYFTEKTANWLENVNIYSDGALLKAMNSAAFSPVLGNTAGQTLTNVECIGMALNANGVNGAQAPAAVTPVTATPVTVATLTGLSTGTGFIAASAAVTHININGLTDANGALALAGPWYVTMTDTITITFSAGQTFTFTSNIDGLYVYGMANSSIIAAGGWGSGQTFGSGTYQAGVALCLDGGTVQNQGNNYIDVASSLGGWAAGLRLNGTTTYVTADNDIERFVTASYGARLIDIAQNSDTNTFNHLRGTSAANGSVAFWVGSGGTSGTSAKCNRQMVSGNAIFDNTTFTANGLVLGYYNNDNTNPSVQIPAMFLGGTLVDWNADVLDVRSPVVRDYLVYNTRKPKYYSPLATTTRHVPGNAGAITLAATFKMGGLGADGTDACVVTPLLTGNIKATLVCQMETSVAADGFKVALYQGAVGGGAPANGAAVTGTIMNQNAKAMTATIANSDYQPITLVGYAPGLTVGTQYWVDFAVAWVTTGGALVAQNIDCIIEELPQ